jgi:hypothetical protein
MLLMTQQEGSQMMGTQVGAAGCMRTAHTTMWFAVQRKSAGSGGCIVRNLRYALACRSRC